MPKRDVVVSYVRGEKVDGKFLESMLRLQGTEARIAEVYGRISGPAVALMRNLLVLHFLHETDADWLWMVDTDMGFEPDIVSRLIHSANPDTKPVVGGLCFADGDYGGPIKPTLYNGELLDEVLYDYRRDTMNRVGGTGAACLLMHRKALTRFDMCAPMPWFADEIVDGIAISEDKTFCRRLRALGIPLWVDTAVKLTHRKVGDLDEPMYLRQRAEEKVA